MFYTKMSDYFREKELKTIINDNQRQLPSDYMNEHYHPSESTWMVWYNNVLRKKIDYWKSQDTFNDLVNIPVMLF